MIKVTLTLIALFFTCSVFSQSFVSPIGFVQTDASKEEVLTYIRKQVYDDCTKIGMNDPSTLRIMEKQNLDAFKELINVANTSLLKTVIKTCCDIGMCNYATILIMYKQQNKDSEKKTEW